MIRRNAILYFLTFLVGLGGTSCVYYFASNQLRAASMLRDRLPLKVRYYREHKDRYDTVYFGDSRAYCAFHPEDLDPLTGRRSINLSVFAHWLPTQLGFVEDVLPDIPQHTRIVWAVGHQNFFPVSGTRTITDRYPIGWRNAAWFFRLGLPPGEILFNLGMFNPATSLLVEAPKLLNYVHGMTDRPLVTFERNGRNGKAGADGNAASLARRTAALRKEYEARPDVGRADPLTEDGAVTSMALHRHGGGYQRVELDPAFFRRKQAEQLENLGGPLDDDAAEAFVLPDPDPRFMALFEEILAALSASGQELVVIEMEEAPFMYRHPLVRQRWREFMAREIQPRVEAAGARYVRIDTRSLRSEDYFDYNHLNETGIGKFSRLVAPHL